MSCRLRAWIGWLSLTQLIKPRAQAYRAAKVLEQPTDTGVFPRGDSKEPTKNRASRFNHMMCACNEFFGAPPAREHRPGLVSCGLQLLVQGLVPEVLHVLQQAHQGKNMTPIPPFFRCRNAGKHSSGSQVVFASRKRSLRLCVCACARLHPRARELLIGQNLPRPRRWQALSSLTRGGTELFGSGATPSS